MFLKNMINIVLTLIKISFVEWTIAIESLIKNALTFKCISVKYIKKLRSLKS